MEFKSIVQEARSILTTQTKENTNSSGLPALSVRLPARVCVGCRVTSDTPKFSSSVSPSIPVFSCGKNDRLIYSLNFFLDSDANSVAHELAKFSFCNKCDNSWANEPPGFLLSQLVNDVIVL